MTSGYGVEVGRIGLFAASELSSMSVNVISDELRVIVTTDDSSIVRLMSYDLLINNLWKLTNSALSENITNVSQFIVRYDDVLPDLQRIIDISYANSYNEGYTGDSPKDDITSDIDMMLYYMLRSTMPREEDIPIIMSLKERIEEHGNLGRYPFLPYRVNTNSIPYSGEIGDIIPITRVDGDLQYTTSEFIDTLRRWHNAHIFRDLMTE